jgi:hypothetical protein
MSDGVRFAGGKLTWLYGVSPSKTAFGDSFVTVRGPGSMISFWRSVSVALRRPTAHGVPLSGPLSWFS